MKYQSNCYCVCIILKLGLLKIFLPLLLSCFKVHFTYYTWEGTCMAWFSIRPPQYTVHTVHCILHIAYWTAHLLTCVWEIFVLITEVVIIRHHRLRHCIIICLGRHVHVLEISWLHSGIVWIILWWIRHTVCALQSTSVIVTWLPSAKYKSHCGKFQCHC